MELKQAQRKRVKLKIGFSGASGFGKTLSALLMAYGVTGNWSKIAVIDTENRSAALYSNYNKKGIKVGRFNIVELDPPFTPERYIEAIHLCEKENMEVVIVDSISHEWEGTGGCLEIEKRLTEASRHKSSYITWGKVTPMHRNFINAILQSPCHIFTTVRRKQDYDMSKDNGGKIIVQKVGMKEVTREGFEYEITTNFEFQSDKHYVTASKDRTGLFDDEEPFIITIETGKELKKWANEGVDEIKYLIGSIKKTANRAELLALWNNNKEFQENPDVIKVFESMAKKYPAKKTTK